MAFYAPLLSLLSVESLNVTIKTTVNPHNHLPLVILYVLCLCVYVYSLGGPQPYVPVGLDDEGASNGAAAGSSSRTAPNQRRARVLCSYDAKDATELNLTGNEVCTLQLS